ncbi:hypothetical protein B9T31_12235 [Acinetobacter sp. ANC 4558]|nr:hypothetical protein B9T31_12235 [Acinetobacter sp. ANC 4558]
MGDCTFSRVQNDLSANVEHIVVNQYGKVLLSRSYFKCNEILCIVVWKQWLNTRTMGGVMSLIESLGGYENAQKVYLNRPEQDNDTYPKYYSVTKDEYFDGCGYGWSVKESRWIEVMGSLHEKDLISINTLGEELVEYRKSNNFYEINDFVVLDQGVINTLFQVETITLKQSRPKTLKFNSISNYSVGRQLIRHATEEEIKAGRRLETLHTKNKNHLLKLQHEYRRVTFEKNQLERDKKELQMVSVQQSELIKGNELKIKKIKDLLQVLVDDNCTIMRPSMANKIFETLRGDSDQHLNH